MKSKEFDEFIIGGFNKLTIIDDCDIPFIILEENGIVDTEVTLHYEQVRELFDILKGRGVVG